MNFEFCISYLFSDGSILYEWQVIFCILSLLLGGPIWETGRILETLIQFRNSGANTSHRGKTALSPTYCHLSNGTFGVNTITECQGERSMRKNLGCNGHCPNVFMTPIAPMMNFLRVVVVDFFALVVVAVDLEGKQIDI